MSFRVSEFVPEDAEDLPAPKDEALLMDLVLGPFIGLAGGVEGFEADDAVSPIPNA